ncbi:uncharacterized protein LOC105914345 [Setaria italica]|uniref:uncharacterized protein LOC105914345 n=1 Tax=Setaria italica TaxID=4555 RepID=UPI000645CD68|nr:uncharacterized protein LOC105914345 [Setaria italica]
MADPSRGIGTGTLRRPARRLAGIIARTALPRSLRSFHRPLRGYAGGLENSDASEVCLKRHLTGGDHARFISRFGCGCGTPLLALYMLVHVRFPSFALSNEDHGFTEDQRYETYLSLRRQTLRSMNDLVF